jgi:hypothetical protein
MRAGYLVILLFLLLSTGQAAHGKNSLLEQDMVQAKIMSLESRIQRRKDLGFPVATLSQQLRALKAEFADLLDQRPAGQFETTARALAASLEDLESHLEESSPYKWYLSGIAVVGFLIVVFYLLISYQSGITSTDSGKEDTDMTEDKRIEAGQSGDSGLRVLAGPRTGSSWITGLALLIALLALALVIHGKLSSSTPEAVQGLSQTITTKLVPHLNEADQRATRSSVYELKRMMITMDEIRDNSSDGEVKTRIDKIKNDMDELAVKILARE